MNRYPLTEKRLRVRCGHCKLKVALGKWSFFTIWDLQLSLGVRYKEVKSQQVLYKAQLAKQWCQLLVMAEHSLSTRQWIWRRTWSGQVTRMPSPYTPTGQPSLDVEIVKYLSNAGNWWEAEWEQVPILHLLWNYWKVQHGAARVWNCHRLMVQTECGPAAALVLQGFAWLFTSLSLLCFLFQVLLLMLPSFTVFCIFSLSHPHSCDFNNWD